MLLHSRGLRKAMKLYIRKAPRPECVHRGVDPDTGECKNTFQLWGACRTDREMMKLEDIVLENYNIDGNAIYRQCKIHIDSLRKQGYFDIAV